MYSQAVATPDAPPAFLRPAAPDAGPVARPVPTASLSQVIVIDATSRLVEATAGGHALLADGGILRSSFGRLAAATHRIGARLAAAIATTLAEGRACAAFEDRNQCFEAEFFALHQVDHGDVHIVIMLKSLRAEQHRHLRAVRAAFGLTNAESRVLEALCEGCSIPQAADLLGVARSTARTHLQRVFDKTGVRRQGDLMRVVAGGG